MENIVLEEQEGFRQGNSTVNQIHTVKQIIGKCYEFKHKLLMFLVIFTIMYMHGRYIVTQLYSQIHKILKLKIEALIRLLIVYRHKKNCII